MRDIEKDTRIAPSTGIPKPQTPGSNRSYPTKIKYRMDEIVFENSGDAYDAIESAIINMYSGEVRSYYLAWMSQLFADYSTLLTIRFLKNLSSPTTKMEVENNGK